MSDSNLPPSKSQRKRDAHDLTELGRQLVNLDAAHCQALELPDRLMQAIQEARRIRQHGALKRQLLYIGKLLRQIDAEPIRQQLSVQQRPHQQAVALHHEAEQWRDRLLAEPDSALNELLTLLPHADRQQLRQLVRNAHKEQAQSRPPKSARQLFRYLHEHLQAQAAD